MDNLSNVIDREIPVDAKLMSVTVSMNPSGQYFASVLVEQEITHLPKTRKSIGIDVGLKEFLTTNNNTQISNPRYFRKNQVKLAKLQKYHSRKVKGSNNRYKCKLKLARKHEKIKNQKLDYLHNITTNIVKDNQIIILEDLNVSGMMKNHKLSKAIAELGLYEMRRQIEYKSKWYGREMILISRWFPSSKKCSCCGNIKHNLKLSDRIYKCDKCGLEIDMDANASINIEDEGNRIYKENKIGQRLSESGAELSFATLVDNPTMDDKEFTPLKSSGWMKQEDVACIEISKFRLTVYECLVCGLKLDRDLNASINIEALGVTSAIRTMSEVSVPCDEAFSLK